MTAKKKNGDNREELTEGPEAGKLKSSMAGQLDNPTNDTDAGRTIVANPTDASKMALLNTAVDALQRMDKMDLSHFLQQTLDTVGHEADPVDDKAADQNQQSITPRDSALNAMTPNLTNMAKEDMDEVLKDAELSEDIREKMATLFESAVNIRVKAIQAQMEEDYEEQMNDEIRRVTDEIVEQIDEYVSHAAQEWLSENKIAVESSLKTELTEDFINGLWNLFSEHYVNIPDEKVDVTEKLTEKVANLEEQLDEEYKTNMQLTKELREHNRKLMIENHTYGMTLPQKERFKTLAEELDYEDPDKFEKKLDHVYESVTGQERTDEERRKTDIWEEYSGSDHDDSVTEDGPAMTDVENAGAEQNKMSKYKASLSRLSKSNYLGAGS